MGGRRFMENFAGVGVSATAVQELTQDELSEITEDPKDEVPFVSRIRTIDEDGELKQSCFKTFFQHKMIQM